MEIGEKIGPIQQTRWHINAQHKVVYDAFYIGDQTMLEKLLNQEPLLETKTY